MDELVARSSDDEIESAFASQSERDWSTPASDELLATARLVGPQPSNVLRPILDAVRQAHKAETPELDELANRAAEVIASVADEPPYAQGHRLADRSTSLPLVEVLVGRTAKHVEQRARAFAAELLLPRGSQVQRSWPFDGDDMRPASRPRVPPARHTCASAALASLGTSRAREPLTRTALRGYSSEAVSPAQVSRRARRSV